MNCLASELRIGELAIVQSVQTPAGAAPHNAAPDPRLRWLTDIGFIPGEPVEVLRRGLWGADPLVLRIGSSTFALRRAEADCIRVLRRSVQELSAT